MYNLAHTHLTNAEKQLLSKGLKFCPSVDKPQNDQYTQANDELHRKLLVTGYFISQEEQPQDITSNPENKFIQQHKLKSNWKPTQNQLGTIPIAVKIFAEDIRNKLRKATTNTNFPKNITKHQEIALRKLMRRKDIIIRQADKGSGVVIISHEQYKKEVERQVNNKKHYAKLDTDTTQLIRDNIKEATHNISYTSPHSTQTYKQIGYQTSKILHTP